jgi:hypothetical protein
MEQSPMRNAQKTRQIADEAPKAHWIRRQMQSDQDRHQGRDPRIAQFAHSLPPEVLERLNMIHQRLVQELRLNCLRTEEQQSPVDHRH